MKTLTLILTILLILSYPTKAQDKIKARGFQTTAFPTISYNSDSGFQLGALADIYYYGDGSNFPNYLHKLYLSLGWANKGTKYGHIYYDSSSLIPHVRSSIAATYKVSSMFPFYGFNGLSSPYDKSKDLNHKGAIAFYNIHKDMLRIIASFQGSLYKKLNWIAGISYWDVKISDYRHSHYKEQNTLYKEYVNNSIIDAREKDGGRHIEFKAGISYDSRDIEANPNNGIWFEAYMYGSKDFINNYNNYLKLAIHYRQYLPIINKRLIFAYHLAHQSLLYGNSPFYLNSEIANILPNKVDSDGLGGANTVRGILLNRLVGNSYNWANFELRLKLLSLNFFNRNWSFYTNPLFDIAHVTKTYRLEEMKSSNNSLIYSGKKDKLHYSAGIGMQLGINYNFILSAEYAKAFDKQDGNQGFSLTVNYIF